MGISIKSIDFIENNIWLYAQRIKWYTWTSSKMTYFNTGFSPVGDRIVFMLDQELRYSPFLFFRQPTVVLPPNNPPPSECLSLSDKERYADMTQKISKHKWMNQHT